MDINKLKRLAGVATEYKSTPIKESTKTSPRGISKALNLVITGIDSKLKQTDSREEVTKLNDAASDVEDILHFVKADKKLKAVNAYKALPKSIQELIKSFLIIGKSTEFTDYFEQLDEMEEPVAEPTET